MDERKQEMKALELAERSRAVAGDGGGWSSFRVPCVLLFACLGLALPGAFRVRPAAAQGSTAVVTGAERLVVRRGPGKRYPPIAELSRGNTVEVLEMHGEWARVVTERGEKGYIKSTFLVLPAERHRGASAPVAETPAAASPPASEAAKLQERNKALAGEVASLRQELADLQNRCESAPAPTANPAPPVPEWHAEITRLATAVEGLERRIDARASGGDAAPATPADGGGHGVSATAMLFAMIGILVGWLIGGTYGRKQERGRRSRIRF